MKNSLFIRKTVLNLYSINKTQLMRIVIFIILFFTSITFSQEKVTFFFDFNKHTLSYSENLKFEHWMRNNSESLILFMIGRTDEKGKVTYNDDLSLKRINDITQLMHGKVKYSSHFNKISLGERFLTSNHDEENRRVDVYYIDKKHVQFENLIVNNINTESYLEKIEVNKIVEYKKILNFNPDSSTFKLTDNNLYQIFGDAEEVVLYISKQVQYVSDDIIVKKNNTHPIFDEVWKIVNDNFTNLNHAINCIIAEITASA